MVSLPAQHALKRAFHRGTLVATAPVFAELVAAPGRDETFVESFFEETGIAVAWESTQAVWRVAVRAFRAYRERRPKQRHPGGRRILADFLIGAHAVVNGCRASSHCTIGCRASFLTLVIEKF